jgi:hypothetical protein
VRPGITISPSEQDLPVQVCPPPLQEPAAPFPVRPALAVTINKAQGKMLQRMGVCLPCSVFSRGQLYVAASGFDAQDHINFAVPNVHGDGLEGVYTDKYGVLGVDQVSTSFLCSAVLLCSVSELLLWCVHCTCTIAEVQVQVALLFLCSAPLSPLPGSVSHDSPHLTAHPLKSAPRTCHAHRTACSRAASARRADPDARLLQTQRSSQRRRASAQPCCGCA